MFFFLFVQGNCHKCTVPKSQMDDSDTHFLPRTKEGMIKAVKEALNEGKFPGWEKEAVKRNNKLKCPQPESTLSPKPIRVWKASEGKYVIGQNRKTTAAAALGRQLLVTFWDTLDGVDLHKQVSIFSIVQMVL